MNPHLLARWSAFCLLVVLTGAPVAAERDPVLEDEKTLKAAGLATDDKALVQFFRERTPKDDELTRIPELIRQLGDDSFSQREKATEDLLALGPPIANMLRQALTDPDIEIVRRAEFCLEKIEP